MGDSGNRRFRFVGAGLLGLGAWQVWSRLRELDVRDSVVMITGGSRGLGYLLAREFARQGARISICAREEAELARVRQELRRDGVEVLATTCDIANRRQVERWVSKTLRHFGRVDVLVNNAGVIQVGPLQAMTVQDFEEAMNIMFWGVLYPTLAVLPHMRQRKSGRIVNITSIGGKISVPHLLPYSCAKFAAVGLSEGLRAELAGEGITVTTIAPGLMRTGSHLNAVFAGRQDREYSWFALGATLPFVSIDAERAARQIVRAARHGKAELIITPQAALFARFHGLFPGRTADLLGLVKRLVLPSPDGADAGKARGAEVARRAHGRVFKTLTGFGQSAAERFNELPPR